MKRPILLFTTLVLCTSFIFADDTKNDFKNGIYFTVTDVMSFSVEGYKGGINYAYKLSDTNQIRAGINGTFQLNQHFSGNTSDSIFNLGLSSAYLFFFQKDIIRPYYGFGVDLAYSSFTSATTNRAAYLFGFSIPVGFEYSILKWLKVGLEGSFNISYALASENSEPADSGIFNINLSGPVIFLSAWF